MRSAALSIASQLLEISEVRRLAELSLHQGKEGPAWSPYSISFGPASTAVFFNQLSLVDPTGPWDRIAHEHIAVSLEQIARTWLTHSLPDGLYSGISGIAVAIQLMSRSGSRYGRVQSQIDGILAATLQHHSVNRMPHPQTTSWQSYDVITGASGISRSLLNRRSHPYLAKELYFLLDTLVTRSSNIDSPAGFFVRPDNLPTDYHRRQFPAGYTDLGLAHGVAGPLALLSIAYGTGVRRLGMEQAIASLADWLWTNRQGEFSWPMGKGPDNVPSTSVHPPSKPVWCYGAVGIASSLFLAGSALAEQKYMNQAVSVLESLSADSYTLPMTPILCHGIAGVLQVTLRFLQTVRSLALVALATKLAESLMHAFSPERPLGFCDVVGESRIDSPSFLDGAAGIGLVLLSASTDVNPEWDQLLMLS